MYGARQAGHLFGIQVSGVEGSAVVGLHGCKTRHRAGTPQSTWHPDQPTERDCRDDWAGVPDDRAFDDVFERGWAEFVRQVVADESSPRDPPNWRYERPRSATFARS